MRGRMRARACHSTSSASNCSCTTSRIGTATRGEGTPTISGPTLVTDCGRVPWACSSTIAFRETVMKQREMVEKCGRCAIVLWLAPFVLVATSAVTHADATDDYVRTEMAKKRVPGLSVAVMRDGRVVNHHSPALPLTHIGSARRVDRQCQHEHHRAGSRHPARQPSTASGGACR